MSNFLAIATATATLRQILDDAVKIDVNGANVSTLRPNAPANELPNPGVNLYLYQVTPNAAWRNADLPTRRANGELTQRPRLALDLHYLLTFYGDENKLEPQRLLGSAASALHAQPLLSREKIRAVINAAIAIDPQDFLAASNLDEEVELVKFTPLALNLEELSKLWSVFFQTAYSLSVAYQGTLVLIEREVTPQVALPVRERNIYVMPFRQPVIERVESGLGPGQPITAGSPVRLMGTQLRGHLTEARIGNIGLTPSPGQVSDTQIEVTLPAGLRAGVQTAQVVQPVPMGQPPLPHAGFESNIAPFVLHPTITAGVSNVTSSVVNGVTFHAADVTITFTPAVGRGQRVVLLLNEFQTMPSLSARAYSFNAPPWSEQPTGPTEFAALTIPVSRIIPGQYLLRVQVDGAESGLVLDANGRYNEPKVTI